MGVLLSEGLYVQRTRLKHKSCKVYNVLRTYIGNAKWQSYRFGPIRPPRFQPRKTNSCSRMDSKEGRRREILGYTVYARLIHLLIVALLAANRLFFSKKFISPVFSALQILHKASSDAKGIK